MSDSGRPKVEAEMSCEEVAELAGLYVLGALESAEYKAITAHLASCAEAHAEVREVGGVVPALAALVEPIDAPAALKARVMAAVADADQSRAGASVRPRRPSAAQSVALNVPTPAWKVPTWASWGSAVAALVIVAVVGVWALGIQSRASIAEQRAADLVQAVAAFSAPDSSVAILRDNTAGGSSGFAAIASDGTTYLVMVNLPPAPTDQAYQAWYIVGDQPISAGLLTVDQNGLAVFVNPETAPGTQVVALTREPEGGSAQPTSAPFVAGELRRQS